jgi:16S rRNA (cytosine1402-N4)-methyltransferase
VLIPSALIEFAGLRDKVQFVDSTRSRDSNPDTFAPVARARWDCINARRSHRNARPRDGAIYIDGTFGGGGYSRALLDAAKCRVLAIDLDPDAIERGREMARRYDGRLILFHGPFSEMEAALAEIGEQCSDGVVLDLGVSSFEFDQAERGFSFAKDGPPICAWPVGTSAADLVNSGREGIGRHHRYGEERQARASRVPSSRPVRSRTAALAEVVSKALGPAAQRE